MGVKGDLAAALSSRNMTTEQARELLNYILDHANAPDFAYKYADQQFARGTDKHNDEMCNYWDVIKFLKTTV